MSGLPGLAPVREKPRRPPSSLVDDPCPSHLVLDLQRRHHEGTPQGRRYQGGCYQSTPGPPCGVFSKLNHPPACSQPPRSRIHYSRLTLTTHSLPHHPHRNQHPAMLRGVRDLKNRKDIDTTFLCLSNSNTVYIDTILKVRTCLSLFVARQVVSDSARHVPSPPSTTAPAISSRKSSPTQPLSLQTVCSRYPAAYPRRQRSSIRATSGALQTCARARNSRPSSTATEAGARGTGLSTSEMEATTSALSSASPATTSPSSGSTLASLEGSQRRGTQRE